jgi:hypothetical protein
MSDEPNASSAQHSHRLSRKLILLSASFVVLAILGFLFVRNLVDFPVYYAAGRSLISGRTDLYSPDFALGRVMDYRYPPFFLVVLIPLWLLPYSVAAYVWYLVSILEIGGCFAIIMRAFPALREKKALLILVALAVAEYFVMVLHYGNIHLLVIFLLFAAFYFVLQNKNIPAAILMSLAITIKLVPILLLPYFALKKRWSLLAGIGVFLIVLNVTPSAYFGFRENTGLLRAWYGHVVASQSFHEENGPIDLSLKGELRRYLSPVDYSQRVDGDIHYRSVNFASLDRNRVEETWAFIAAGLFAGGLVLMWWLSSRAKETADGVDDIDDDFGVKPARHDEFSRLELSLMVCLMLLVGPLTSKIYFIALLWPVACVASFAVDTGSRLGNLAKRVLVVVCVVNLVLPLLPGRPVQRMLLALGSDFYVNCLVMGSLLYLLVSSRGGLRTRSGALQTPDPSAAKMP